VFGTRAVILVHASRRLEPMTVPQVELLERKMNE
jgi:hypothetical protein